jgi:osmotically-inducible protein OsmY
MNAAEESLDAQVTKALAHDQRTAKAAIDVACVGGRITLTGTVGSAATKAAVLDVARRIPGVVALDDEIAIKAGAGR